MPSSPKSELKKGAELKIQKVPSNKDIKSSGSSKDLKSTGSNKDLKSSGSSKELKPSKDLKPGSQQEKVKGELIPSY
jgi:hypothetical protein